MSKPEVLYTCPAVQARESHEWKVGFVGESGYREHGDGQETQMVVENRVHSAPGSVRTQSETRF